jgi:hypothetical protein
MPSLEGKPSTEQVKILKDELMKERKRNLELERQLQVYKKASSVTGNREREKIEGKYA